MSNLAAGPSLVLHADDFGLNAAVTQGIIDGFSAGLLTSTSILANAPAAGMAVDLWRQLEKQRAAGKLTSLARRSRLGDSSGPFDLGVHLNLTQGQPLTGSRYPDELLDRGCFLPPGALFRKLVVGGHVWRDKLAQELSAQIIWLLDHRLQPTHLNGHQYVEMMPVIAELVPSLARRFSIPYVRSACEPGHWRTSMWPGLRLAKCGVSFVKQHYAARFRRRLCSMGLEAADAYFGGSHAGLIDMALMYRFLRLSAGFRRTEVALHPGRDASEFGAPRTRSDGWSDPLADRRPNELSLLCSADLAELFIANGVRLRRLNDRSRRAVAA